MALSTNDPLVIGPRTGTPPARRHPLGLPPGSVRALIVLMVAGLVWALILTAKDKVVELPLYLCYLLFLILGSFFAAHGNSIAGTEAGGRSPLHLPRGSLRLLVVLGFALVIGWRTYSTGEFPEFRTDNPGEHPFLPLWLLGAFFLGILFNGLRAGLSGAGKSAAWFQDILAWVSLLAMFGLAAEVVILFLINPTLSHVMELPKWQTFLSAVVGFYFGARC